VAMLTQVRAPALALPLGVAGAAVPFVALWSRMTDGRPLYTRMSLETIRLSHQQISHALASHELGYQPRPFEVTIRDTVNWFREQGELSPGSGREGR